MKKFLNSIFLTFIFLIVSSCNHPLVMEDETEASGQEVDSEGLYVLSYCCIDQVNIDN